MSSKDKTAINEYVGRLSHETSQILEEIVELTYYMRGSIQYNDLLHLSIPEKRAISDFISNRLEHELKKPGYAIY